jgi:hypothetical protein
MHFIRDAGMHTMRMNHRKKQMTEWMQDPPQESWSYFFELKDTVGAFLLRSFVVTVHTTVAS